MHIFLLVVFDIIYISRGPLSEPQAKTKFSLILVFVPWIYALPNCPDLLPEFGALTQWAPRDICISKALWVVCKLSQCTNIMYGPQYVLEMFFNFKFKIFQPQNDQSSHELYADKRSYRIGIAQIFIQPSNRANNFGHYYPAMSIIKLDKKVDTFGDPLWSNWRNAIFSQKQCCSKETIILPSFYFLYT